MPDGLTEEQRAAAIGAAAAALVTLLVEHPEVAKVPAGVITTVFVAGVGAGIDALDGVLKAAE
jgi:hypothetical protein